MSPPSFICCPIIIAMEIFLRNCASNLFKVTCHYLFMKSIWYKVVHKQFCCALTRLISSEVDLKYIFTIFCFFANSHEEFLNNRGVSCFHKSNHTCLCYFYHMCSIQRWLIGRSLKVSKFDWFTWIRHSALRNIANSFCWSIINLIKLHSVWAKTKRSSSDSCSMWAI